MASKRTRGTYYAGRVLKSGQLDDERIIGAILEPTSIIRGQSAWTFIDPIRITDGDRDFVFARLIKYSPDAEVRVVDAQRRQEVLRSEPNLSIAASPFLYIPAHSGIAFLRIAQHIEQHAFAARFAELIEARYGGFFVGCEVEFITDLRTFAAKLSKLQAIFRLDATVHPPNPLFGPLWKSLKNYMEVRDIDDLRHEEAAGGDKGLKTELPAHVAAAANQTEANPYFPKADLPIGDAAVLMAADGYGSGHVYGRTQDATVVIRTSDTVRNFSFSRDPDPVELFDEANGVFEEIKAQRHMEHGDAKDKPRSN